MRTPARSIVVLRLLLAACAGAPAGCGSAPPADRVTPEGTVVQSRLTAVHTLFRIFRSDHERSPKDMQEINDFGAKLPSDRGGPVSLNPAFLTSPRDKEPLVVRFGLEFPDDPNADGPILAYEAKGYEGRRFVIYALSGRVELLDDVDVIQQAM